MFWQTVLAASVLAAQANAGVVAAAEGLLSGRASSELERRMASQADDKVARDGFIPRVFYKRQSAASSMATPAAITTTTAGTGVVLNPDGTINMTAWDNTATVACNDALTKLPESSNPSGTCICYNLPALDNATGTFEADLRLFQLSTPSGAFAGIPPENIQVGLSYAGASVSPVSVATASKLVVGRDTTTTTSQNGTLRLLQTYLFVGQIRKDLIAANPNMAQLEALVTPTVTLTGTGNGGQTVSTNVSSNEAAFVAGIFSNTVVLSNATLAQENVNSILNGLNNGTVAFVLPGVQLILFPVGLVIYSTWLVVGLAAIGYGTAMRISFREQFKRRAVQAVKPASGNI